MTTIVGLSGSLRRRSYNAGLLRAAAGMMPEGATLTIVSIAGIPLYDADVEARGIPVAVSAIKDAIAAADGVLLATPEYNNGIPGVFKNAIDWCSRPAEDIGRVFDGRPFAVIGASPGGFGTILSQDAWLAVLRALRTQLWTGGRLMIPGAGKAFDEEGDLIDPAVKEKLKHYLDGFVASIRA
jgi:NAD(P)H-dependent FMN reductase